MPRHYLQNKKEEFLNRNFLPGRVCRVQQPSACAVDAHCAVFRVADQRREIFQPVTDEVAVAVLDPMPRSDELLLMGEEVLLRVVARSRRRRGCARSYVGMHFSFIEKLPFNYEDVAI